MELLVTNYGSFLGKKSERLVLKENGKVVSEIPFHDLEHVIIDTPGASLSTDVIRECVEQFKHAAKPGLSCGIRPPA